MFRVEQTTAVVTSRGQEIAQRILFIL